jgi:hypothetical protein
MIFNPVIVGAIVGQVIIAKVSRIAGAIVGYVITTGILLWGLSIYGNGHQLAFFGIPLSQPIFVMLCLVWYGFDTKEFIAAKKTISQGSTDGAPLHVANMAGGGTSQATKRCPACAESILLDATTCRFCGRNFSPQEVSQARQDHDAQLRAAESAAHQAELVKQQQLQLKRLQGQVRRRRLFGILFTGFGGLIVVLMIAMFIGADEQQKTAAVSAGILFGLLPLAVGITLRLSREMSDGKQRHGCLTAFLVLMIIANSVVAVMYLFGSAAIRQNVPSAPGWAFPVLAIGGIVNVVCAIALFQWKKWGFFGFIATAAVAFVVNLMIGINILQALLGLVGIAVLYWVLQMGKEKKGWTQLE